MRRFSFSRNAWRGVVLGALVAAVVVALVGPAHAGNTSTKWFDASVLQNGNLQTSGGVTTGSFTVTLINDSTSSQQVGSANFAPPAGFTLSGLSTPTASGAKDWSLSCLGDGSTCSGTGSGAFLMLRAASTKGTLNPGEQVVATFSATIPSACTSASESGLWGPTEVKQSNNFSGVPGNDVKPLTIDLDPLGGFSWDTIGTQTKGVGFTGTVHALDTCGKSKTDYTAGGFYKGGASLTYTGLDGATPAPPVALSDWSLGTATTPAVTPAIAEGGNHLVATDGTGVSGASNSFLVVDKVCKPGDTCTDSNANDNLNVTSPTSGSVGVGLIDVNAFNCGGATTPLGSVAAVDPSADAYSGSFYTVTMTILKSVVGTRKASTIVVCISKDSGATWQVLPNCSAKVGPPCVSGRKDTTLGAQLTLHVAPGDPYVGGR